MPSPPKIDFDTLLKPIPGDKPAGRDGRESKHYDALKEARREEEALNQGEWKRDTKVADWPKVIDTAFKILTQESKDLEIAVWLTEGLVKRYGFAGLRDGLGLLRRLHETFWETMYPLVEDGDLEYRMGRIEALGKLLPMPIKAIAITHPPGGPYYSYWQYKESQDIENLRRGAEGDADKKKALAAALSDGKLEGEKFNKAVDATPLPHCVTLLEDATQALDEVEKLDKILAEKYGDDAPSVRAVKEAVLDCQGLLDSIVRKKGGSGVKKEGAAGEGEAAAEDQGPAVSGGIRPLNRAEAVIRLQAIAEFFQATEPHSPVAYLAQRAARWAEMPLSDWLREVIKNPGVLGEVRETLGIRDADGSGKK